MLVIEADRPELPLYVAANDAFRTAVRDSSRKPVEVLLESLDLERFGQEGYQDHLRKWVGTKYRGRPPGAVVTPGHFAHRAAVGRRDALWPGTPVVFSGVDHGTFESLDRVPDSTGTLIEFGHLDTIRTALELLPATGHLAIVGGQPDRDPHVRLFSLQIAAAFGDRLEIIEFSGLPMADSVERTRKLPDHSIVIVTSINIDGAGRVFTGQEVCALLAAKANAPVFWFLRPYLGSGIVGGVLFDPVIAGCEVGALTARVLDGEPAASIAWLIFGGHP